MPPARIHIPLHARGLSIQEAFAIATRRLGSERQLSAEFAKANPQRALDGAGDVDGDRGACGSCAARGYRPYSNLRHELRPLVRSEWTPGCSAAPSDRVDYLDGSGRQSRFGFSAGILHRLDRLVRVCLQRPVLTGLGLFIGLQCLQYGMGIFTLHVMLFRRFPNPSRNRYVVCLGRPANATALDSRWAPFGRLRLAKARETRVRAAGFS